jgi:hypothetical protein
MEATEEPLHLAKSRWRNSTASKRRKSRKCLASMHRNEEKYLDENGGVIESGRAGGEITKKKTRKYLSAKPEIP